MALHKTSAKLEVSIIIPCFNCEKTLREAVHSCYLQGLTSFEIVLVDDCSTDSTRAVMQELAEERDNIKLFYHESNRGGGATRNTATEQAVADLVFCLDSDDMLPPHTLDAMLRMQKETSADGIGIETSVKFRNTDIEDIAYINTFGYAGQIIPLESLLERNGIMCPLYSTFLYTKEAFTKIGGYPTTHGFDTQGFAWRFLANGLVAYTCPGTTYFHRINFHESYYLSEYNAGKTNFNWRTIILEQNHVLSDVAYNFVKNFDVRDFESNILDELKKIPNVFSNKHQRTDASVDEMASLNPVPRNSIRGIFYRVRSKFKKLLFKFNLYGKLLFIKSCSYIAFIKSHIRSKQPLYALFAWHLMRIKKMQRIDFKTWEKVRTDVVDLVLPTIAKDFDTLQTVIESARKHVQHTIGTIYIVTRPNQLMAEFCHSHGYVLVDESTVLGYGKEAIHYFVEGVDRRGWLFQQLLKLAGDQIAKTENFISIDSDTILIRPHSFMENGKFIFRQNEEWHAPYFAAFEKMFGYPVRTWFSYTSHMMMFDKEMLHKMKMELEARHKKSWDKVYIGTANPKEISCVSDYDTYANWVQCNYPYRVKNTILYNKTLLRAELVPLTELENRHNKQFHSVSFHSYAANS